VILHINHLPSQGGHLAAQKDLAARASALLGALLALVEEGRIDSQLLPALRVHFDWIQYRANFREPVIARRATDAHGAPMTLAEIAVDLRQAEPGRFRDDLLGAVASMDDAAAGGEGRVHLDDFVPVRESVIWHFNRLFWQRVGDWEAATGRSFEQALPSGQSDANHAQAVADSLARAMAERARADSVHAQVLREPDSAAATLMPSGLEAARSEALAEPVHFELDRSDLTAEAQRRLQEYGYQG